MIGGKCEWEISAAHCSDINRRTKPILLQSGRKSCFPAARAHEAEAPKTTVLKA